MASLNSERLSSTTATEMAAYEAENRQRGRRPMAFQLEAMILLVFLTLSLAIMATVFGHAWSTGVEADELSHAICLASSGAENGAENFAARPSDETSTTWYCVQDGELVACDENTDDVYTVTRTASAEAQEGGTLYYATIAVDHAGHQVYSLDTARYVSEGR